MQSDGNSFCGDVVFGSVNMVNRDEDSILDQKYEKQISWDLNHEDFIFQKWLMKMHIWRNKAHNNKELKQLGFRDTVVLVTTFVLCYKELKLSIK